MDELKIAAAIIVSKLVDHEKELLTVKPVSQGAAKRIDLNLLANRYLQVLQALREKTPQ